MKSLLSISILVFLACSAMAENLETYRKLSNVPTEKSAERVKEIREMNGKFRDLDLIDDAKTPIAYPSENGRPMRRFSSSYFRAALDQAGVALKEVELRGKPRTFDPSMQVSELDEARWKKRREIFNAEIVNKNVGSFSVYDHILNQLYADIQIQNFNANTPNAVDSSAFENRLAAALRNHIRNYQPRAEDLKNQKTFKTIETVLGRLDRVEVYDSYVSRLVFVSEVEGKSVNHVLNLGMLANVRSGADEFFVIMLGLLSQQIETEIDTFYKINEKDGGFVTDKEGKRLRKSLSKDEVQRVEKLEAIYPYISTRFDEAVEANKTLLHLDPVQLSFLIDLMLQLRKQDVPVEDELNGLTQILSAEMIKIDQQNDAIELAAEKANIEPKKITRIEKFNLGLDQVEKDMGFYIDLNRQLYRLQGQLEFERGAK